MACNTKLYSTYDFVYSSHCSVWSKSVIRQIPMIIGNLSLIFIPCISLILLSPFSGLILLCTFNEYINCIFLDL